MNIFYAPRIHLTLYRSNDDARTCLLWASAGLGVALVPETITNLPLSKGLSIHPIACPDTMTRMAAVYKKSGYVSNIAKEFVSYFLANFSHT